VESLDVLDAVNRRRSVRAFRTEEVSPEIVQKLIDSARRAPSAGNIQPWEFIVVRKQEVKMKVAHAALNQMFVEEASVVIVVCADEMRCLQGYGLRGKNLYCIQDTAAATQNMLLVAYSLGLGTCWIGAFSEEKVREALKIPRGIRPVALVPIGYPDESLPSRKRRYRSMKVHYESF